MARKESITQTDLLKAAFEMLREQGSESVTARKLASKAGCSTQPIFRIYQNMEEMNSDLFEMSAGYFEDYYSVFPRENEIPFVDMGLAYIRFAEENPHIFRMLFLSRDRYGKSLYDLLNGKKGFVSGEITQAGKKGCKDPGDLFMKMWVFIHGAACMALTGDYDLEREDTRRLLEECFQSFLSGGKF